MTYRKVQMLILLFVLLPYFSTAQAQKSSVAIIPASVDANVKRGASYTQKFTLHNNTNTRLIFRCSVEDMGYDSANKRISGKAGTLPRSASLWIQFTPTEIVVEAHSTAVVTALVTIPNTAAGGYYSVPVFAAMPSARPIVEPNAVKASTAYATIGIRFRGLMMFTTEDAAEYNIEIMAGRITAPTGSTELGMELDLRNRGNAHARVRGAFAILNSAGVLAGRGIIGEKRYMPGQTKVLPAGWAGTLPAGKYTSLITLSYDRVGMEPATLVYELPLVVR